MSKTERQPMKVTKGNLFADLGLPAPEEEEAKVRLAIAIKHEIKRQHLSQTKAAHLVGLSQPDISRIVGGALENYSRDRLVSILTAFGKHVTIVVDDAFFSDQRGRVAVVTGSEYRHLNRARRGVLHRKRVHS